MLQILKPEILNSKIMRQIAGKNVAKMAGDAVNGTGGGALTFS